MTNLTLSELLSLQGKTALVTGGAMGIGLGIVERLCEAGSSVVIADINEAVGNETTANLKSQGKNVAYIKCDVSVESEVKAAVEFVVTTFGTLDILVNNAGIFPTVPVAQMDYTLFEKIQNTNLNSVFLFTKYTAEKMIAGGRGGKIINITSIDALHPSAVGLASYDASKHGVWGFTKNSALEFAPHGITINAVAPGGIATPGTGMVEGGQIKPELKEIVDKFITRIPLKRMGQPDDIGKVVLFMASGLSDYMTGTQVVVDGGVLLS